MLAAGYINTQVQLDCNNLLWIHLYQQNDYLNRALQI